ncbi:MAG: xylanase deacetylase [Cohnella sp.]|uniref:polysaccharide deacetylase n=1 Tax=Cohnella sp. TaxID=1883426 RepID=UPI000E36F3A8|nr:polysaccharide deacetylase family protein [Cohnella sp.]REK65707.1 MAG: xylanase deacetylase [Cohnella sp.]
MRTKLVFLSLALILVYLFAGHSSSAFARSGQKLYIAVNDQRLSFADAQPEKRASTVFVPVRDMAAAMNLKVEAAGPKVRLSGKTKSVTLLVKENKAVKPGGQRIELWLFVQNGRLMVPLSFLAAYFGYELASYPELPMMRMTNGGAKLDGGEFVKREKARIDQEEAARKLPIYLTFDDGPTAHTMELLDILDEHGAKATFFMLGPGISGYPEAVKRMAAEGHRLGLHGMTHDVKKFYKTPQTALNEMNEANSRLKKAANVTATLIRTPYGSKPYFTKEYRDAAAKAGYHLWDWNVDTDDWMYKKQPDKLLSKLVQDVRALKKKGTAPVVLLHDRSATIALLPRILDALEDEGYKFVAIDEKMEPLNFWQDRR